MSRTIEQLEHHVIICGFGDNGYHASKTLRTYGKKLVVIESDANNLFVVLTARELNSNLKIISRAISEKTEKKLRVAGADNVILPDRVGGTHMASLVVTSDISEFLDKLSVVSANESINLEEVVCTGLRGDKMSLSELEDGEKHSLRILGIKRTHGEYILNPTKEGLVLKGDKLFVLGAPNDIASLAQRS